MKKLSESVGFMVGIFSIAGVAATAAYFVWDQRSLSATNASLSKENALYRSTIEDLEGAISRLENKIRIGKVPGFKSVSQDVKDDSLRTQDSKKELSAEAARNRSEFAQIAPSAGVQRVKKVKTKNAFRFESVGCQVANGNTQCSVLISNITELERSLGIRASDAAMTDMNGDSYSASSARFRGRSANYTRYPMTTSSSDKATWIFEGVAAGAVPTKLSFTVSDQYKENDLMQNRETYEELGMWLDE